MSDRPFVLSSNKNVPQVQNPLADLGSLVTTVRSLKEGVESLGGYRGSLPGRAVTFDDLLALGLLTPITGNSATGTVTSGLVTKDELADLVFPNFSNAEPGWLVLANGLTIQYGYSAFTGGTSDSVVFPITLSSVLNVQITGGSAAGVDFSFNYANLTNAGMDVTTGAPYTGAVFWLVLGI